MNVNEIERLSAAREALLAAFPRIPPESNNFKAIEVLTFEPLQMKEIVELGGLTDTCYQFLNRCARRGLIGKPKTGLYRLIPEGSELLDNSRTDDFVEDEADGPVFALESDLRDFIASNLSSMKINGKPLHPFKHSSGHSGVEYPTDIGFIDILAEDSDKNLVVLELKLGRGPDKAVGQILRYMGWLSKHLAEGRRVSGIIVAREIDEKLKYAVSIVPNIAVFEYKVQFELNEVSLG